MKNKWFARYMAEDNGTVDNSGADGAGAPAPAESSGDNSTDTVNWDEMSTDSDTEGEFIVPAEKESKATEKVEPEKPAEVPAVPATPEVKTEATPEVKPEATATVPTPEPAKDFDWGDWEAKSIAELLPQYALSEDDAAALLTTPEEVLPKMAAAVHVAVIKNVLAHLPQILPNLIQQIQQTTGQETKAADEFYAVNPDLKDAQFTDAIKIAGQAFRQLNPTADRATAIAQVGNMVRMSRGLPQLASKANDTPPAAPRQVPFTPAQGGAQGNKAPADDNVFTKLADEFSFDD